MDGFAILFEPCTDLQEGGTNFVGDGAVGTRTDVEEKVAVFLPMSMVDGRGGLPVRASRSLANSGLTQVQSFMRSWS